VKYLGLIGRSRPAEKARADPSTPPAVKALLERAAEARSFAVDAIGLRDTKNYKGIVILEADRLATVVQACAELSFERHLFSYPVVGKLPYKGFFDPADAEKEAASLRKKGLDVLVRPVDAFSTLGWLADPLWSFMADYSEADLCELIIHEMTHATAFKKGYDSWNEELATFVGREGALAWLKKSAGPDSTALAEAKLARLDAIAFASYVRDTARELEAVYAEKADPSTTRLRKAALIAARAERFEANYEALFATRRYANYPMKRLNNAWLDLYRLYEGESELYSDYFERVSGGDLKAFVADMAILAKKSGDPKAAMRARLD